jgi:polysulfide reductase chain C
MVSGVQNSFNWKIVMYLFFGGTGGGLFLIGYILERLGLMISLAKGAEMLGPILVIIGCIFLLFHSGAGFKTKIHLLFLKPGRSWISRGTWIISVFVVSALIYVLGGRSFWGSVAVVFSMLMAIYPGFILAENKAIPFWRTPILPTLFLFSGLSTGLAFLLLMVPFFSVPTDETMAMALRALSWSDVLIIVIQLVILWNYLSVGSNKEATLSESLRLFIKPLFIVGTLILGLLVPLLLHVFVLTGGKVAGLGMMTGILLVVGGISLRFSVLRAGVYLPRHSL